MQKKRLDATYIPLLLKKLVIRSFLIMAGLPLMLFFLLDFFLVDFSLSILIVILFVLVILVFVKQYFQKLIELLIKSNIYNKAQIAELKEQYELKEQAYQDLENLNFVVDNAALFASIKLDGTVLYMSKKFSDLLGVEEDEVRGTIETLLSQKEGQQQQLRNIFLSTRNQNWQGEVELTARSGNNIWLELSVIPMNKIQGNQTLFVLGNNITENRLRQIELDRLKQDEFEKEVQLQKDQASQIVEAQEGERKRIAKDIHDGIGQILTALKFSVEAISLDNPVKAAEKLADLKEVFGQLIKDVRAVTFSLTPPELIDHGISPALKKMTTEIAKLSGKNILFENKTDFNERFDSLIETNLYRVAQEALNNALKYADASYVLVSVSHTKDLLSIMIDDNGNGFDTSVKINSEKGLGMGLFFMRERVNYVNGRLFIHSSKGEGTRITINIPL